MNIFDPRADLIAQHSGTLAGAVSKDQEFLHPKSGNRVIVWDSRQADPEQQILQQDFVFEELDNAGQLVSRSVSTYVLRYTYRFEMQYLLELCGFEVEALYGDFQGGAFYAGGEQVWVARKK